MNFDKSKFEKMKEELSKSCKNGDLLCICRYLYDNVPYYNWVGFYLVDGSRTLKLGPYVGEPTIHTRIAFGEGICGQAAETMKNFVVQDVSKEQNYLSCSPSVKSEIVIPLIKHGKIIGELDIDSHYLSPFDKKDEEFLGWICDYLVKEVNIN
ncbi:MAG: GAF domain-containing protein [Athalassotoga sp.]|uniref:GAF domain-containing protein n=1 Tax=Athalassotoga sp. TaxID=2022597 RepID=UPI00269B084E